ncbi:hypothetical protein HDV05_007240 [Chytridiales sp. JEL 0842]|nr:hypothetical protein HDV05_007240 [Chytridiales sp. JEL 0842]
MQTGKLVPGSPLPSSSPSSTDPNLAPRIVTSTDLNPTLTPRPLPSILGNALRNGVKAFILGYSIRSGLSFLLKLIGVARGRIAFIKAFKSAFGGQDGLRFGTFFGGFAFLWKATNNIVINLRGKDDKVNGFIAGFVAGVALLAEKKARRITIAQQLLVRGLQACYNHVKGRGLFHFPYGDALIFALGSAQAFHGYVIRPSIIPKSFYKFFVTTGPIPEPILKLVRKSVDTFEPIAKTEYLDALQEGFGGCSEKRVLDVVESLGEFPKVIPCELLHPLQESCVRNSAEVFRATFMKIFPVYASLNFVPMFVLKTRQLLKTPVKITAKGLFNAVRSASFLSALVSSYQALVCMDRDLIRKGRLAKDNKYLYYWIGFLSCGGSIFIEDKRRRSELAMYILPRGVDAFYQALYNRRWIIHIPYFEVFMFSVAMGLVISFLQTEPENLSGVVYNLLRRVNLTIEDRGVLAGKKMGKRDEGQRMGEVRSVGK